MRLRSMGPPRASAAAERRAERLGHPAQAVEHRRRRTRRSAATVPSPSFSVAKARLPPCRSRRRRPASRARRSPPSGRPRRGGGRARTSMAPAVDELARRLGDSRPALEEDGADHRALHGPAHPRPLDRRPGVQDRSPGERGDHLARPAGRRPASGAPPGCARRAVSLAEAHARADRIVGIVLEARHEESELTIATRRRPPGELRDRRAVGARRLGERREADVEWHGRRRERWRRCPGEALTVVALRAVSGAGHEHREAGGRGIARAPAARRRRRAGPPDRAAPCGSAVVPHTEPMTISSRPAFVAARSRRLEHGRELAGRIGVASVAEDDVEQDDGGRRVLGARARSARCAAGNRSSDAAGRR